MANRSSNRSSRLKDEADVRYDIDTPFTGHDATILLIERGDDEVEVIVGDIPVPSGYNLDKNYPDLLENEDELQRHAVAEWIVDETVQMFSMYDWKKSEYKSHNPNYHLRDIYFTCRKNEVDQAVITAKKFINEMEEKTLRHSKRFGCTYHSPSDDL